MIRTVKCHVCKKKVLPVGMANHILGTGRQEVYILYREKGAVDRITGKKPHANYATKHQIETKKFKLKI